ncbi:uncharacterized protein LOC135936813 isoform X1 [Cloeon dipterum]|uniref:uncharacterized protein LOC135936813 isoform X1 n=1 Tax=Cloeon dipterum TaxID=197152 RepID=UPI00321FD988
MASLREHVHPSDVVAAIKTICGPEANLTDYEVLKGTDSVQGFMSCILRVRATCTVGNDPKIKTAQFIVKRMPILEAQRTAAKDMRLFNQEIAFYTKCLPIMQKRCLDLKVATFFFAHSANTIVMEDLSLNGFAAMAKNIEELKQQILNLSQTRMILRELAKFHASSVGTDWLKIVPEMFEQDVVYEANGGLWWKQMIKVSTLNSVIPILEHIYRSDLPKIQKYIDWIGDFEGNVYPLLIAANKKNPKYLNALCHGDCWVNNLMMKFHPVTGEPLELRFIDLQIVRYAPVYSDLLYVMYLSLKSEFRAKHEEALIRTYVEQFNAACNVTPDPIEFDHFMDGYNESRLPAILLAVSMQPIAHVSCIAPAEGGELTEENIKNLLGSDERNAQEKKATSVRVFQKVQSFNQEMKLLCDQMIFEMDKWVFN